MSEAQISPNTTFYLLYLNIYVITVCPFWRCFIGSILDMRSCCLIKLLYSKSYISQHAGLRWVRLDAVRGVEQRTPFGACAEGVGSYRRPSRGQGVCCTPRPPPRFRRPLRPVRRDSPAWTWARRRSSSSTWCVGSETTPDTQML